MSDAENLRSMKGKVVLVTGAASGLGRATAITMAKAGADLALMDRAAEGLAETEKLILAYGGAVFLHVADVSCAQACRDGVEAVVAHYGRLDALCNVAGIMRMTHSTEMPDADFALTMAVNLAAPWYLSQAAIPHLLKVEGAIVNVASSAAFIGEAYAAAYCASKGGLVQMTKALAMEYSRQPIRINAVAPGGMMTNIFVDMGRPENAEADLIARYSGMRGLVAVEDVAEAILLLASKAGRGYHGTCISIDAGITAG